MNGKQKPNIIFILMDDQGAWAMGCAGNTDIQTPSMDRLAREGVRFDQFHCASPVCSPARASIVTGQIPSCHGVQDWISGGNLDAWKYPQMAELKDFDMNDRAIDYLAGHKTYMEVLAENGYVCALSGKWHLGDNAARKKGFSRWYTIGRGGCRYYSPDICDEGEMSVSDRYVTDLITERALDDIRELADGEAPGYPSVHYTAPHIPGNPEEHPREFLEIYKDCSFESTPDLPLNPRQINTCPVGDTKEKRRENLTGYFAAVSAADAGVGRILKLLEDKGLAENTVVIFTADNGMNMGHHGIWGKGNGTFPPNMFESAVKVPFIVRMPECGHKGEVCHTPVSQYDIYPTILELAGCQAVPGPMQPGTSLLPLIQNPLGQKDRDIVVYDEYGRTRMIKKNGYKFIRHYEADFNELYDLKSDPDESVNLWDNGGYKELAAEMECDMEEWFEKYSVPECDGRKHAVTGRGQKDLCYKEGAFDQSMEYV